MHRGSAGSGIYQIRNTINGHVYIGSAVCIRKRWSQHRRALEKGQHHSKRLQNAWNKYGSDVFVFEHLEICSIDALIEREQCYIDTSRPAYNMSPTAGSSLGVKQSKEAGIRKSIALLGERNGMFGRRGAESPRYGVAHSDESRKKMSDALRGRKGMKGESHPMYGRKGADNPLFGRSTPEHVKAKIAKANRPLSQGQVTEIRKMIADGIMQKDIAARLGVSRSSISRLNTGKRYADFTEHHRL